MKNKTFRITKLFLYSIVFLLIFLSGCEMGKHEHKWIEDSRVDPTCTVNGKIIYKCEECGEVKEEKVDALGHHYVEEVTDATCLKDGKTVMKCDRCGDIASEEVLPALGHKEIVETTEATCTEAGKIVTKCEVCGKIISTQINGYAKGHSYVIKIDQKSVDGSIGIKHKECEVCGVKEAEYKYVDNGYSRFGKLHVEGTNLVDANNNPVQLIGLSTHGLQWYGEYVNEVSLSACKEAFNVNVFRFSLYTAEGGYCECNATKKEELYNRVLEGVRIATKLDMYAIVDWHMLGEEDDNDKNPLYYKEQAKEFFDRITKDLKDYDNVFYEIMNEPCGPTKWSDCKKYAEEIIPIIRANKPDAVVLVGTPKWASDLASPRSNPLSFENIMYTFHFYAADLKDTSIVTKAYNAGMPVFVTEHGGMDADGDGDIDKTSTNNWYKVLDARNISYVAWNISHSKGSSAILKSKTKTLDDFSNSNLKEWGIFYKSHIKSRLGITN